ncbi:hypothetical protein [Bacillus subtilis]|uniref:hypothetical protein n=1 Tax=Bacillus subtilis TaxID=1423 RepID=UPI003000F889
MQAAVFRMSARGWGKGLNAVGAFTDLEIGWQREMSAKSCSTPLYIRRSIQFKS